MCSTRPVFHCRNAGHSCLASRSSSAQTSAIRPEITNLPLSGGPEWITRRTLGFGKCDWVLRGALLVAVAPCLATDLNSPCKHLSAPRARVCFSKGRCGRDDLIGRNDCFDPEPANPNQSAPTSVHPALWLEAWCWESVCVSVDPIHRANALKGEEIAAKAENPVPM